MSDQIDSDGSGLDTDRFVDNLPGLAYRCEPTPPWEMSVLAGQVESLTGYAPAAFEAGAVTYASLVEPDDLEDIKRDIRDGIDERRQFTTTYRIRTRADDVKHVFERGMPIVEGDEVTALEGLVIDISRWKTYERRLKRQNDLFVHTQQMADVGGWELDVRTGSLRWTDQVNRIHGIPVDRSVSVDEAIEFYHPEDRPVVTQAIETALEEGELYDHELRIVTEDGDQRWVRAKGVPEVVDGEVVRLRGAIQDVTDRRERELSLRDERTFTEGIFEALPDLLYAFDEEGSMTRWNDQLRRATGYTDAEIAEMDPLDFVPDGDREHVRTQIRTVVERKETIRTRARLRTKAGDLVPYEFTGAPLLDEEGSFRELVGIGRDVSDRMERQRRFEAVFNNTYQFTGLLNPTGEILEVNDAGLSFTAADRSSVVGSTLWDVLQFSTDADRESVRRGYERVVAGESYRDEIQVLGPDGEAVIDFSIRPITDENGEVLFLVPEGQDITEFKERERLVRVLHRLLRHNIRNDLTAIQGYTDTLTELLSDEGPVTYAEQVTEAAENLLTTSEKAKQMVDLILHPIGATKRVNLGVIAQTVTDRFRERYPGTSIVVSVEDSATAACNERIGIAIGQLVENGLEHNTSATPRVAVRVFEREGEAHIEVTDNGIGISADEWSMVNEEISEEPSQVRHGSGIGLLLTQWIVDEFGGSLEYATRDRPGSVVTIRLPSA